MLFAIDIGNTNIHVGVFHKDTMVASFSLGTDHSRSADEYALLLSALAEKKGCDLGTATKVILGSVVPSVTTLILGALRQICAVKPMVVGPGLRTGFPIRIENPSELGADLAANVAGALAAVGAPAIVIDFGTATSVSVIDGQGAYVGGAILSGVGMDLTALRGAELLPGVVPDGEEKTIGKNTAACMRIGVLRGQAMAAMGFYRLYQTDFGAHAPLVVTGGYAPLVLGYMGDEAKYLPDLTLYGLCAIARANEKR